MSGQRDSDRLLIRPARSEDADDIHAALLGIAAAIGKPHAIRSTPQDIRRDGFGDRPHFQVLVAQVGPDFAGMCLYFPIYSTWMGRPGAYVQDLFVHERFRGGRIGERLLHALARRVRDAGGAYIELAVDTANVTAQRFYERVGIAHRADDRIHRIVGEAFLAFAGRDDFSEDP